MSFWDWATSVASVPGDAIMRAIPSPENLPFIGGFFPDKAQEEHQRRLGEASDRFEAYRPEAISARLNALRQGMAAYQPYNQLMGQMYGPGAQMDMSQFWQNPFEGMRSAQQGGASPPREQRLPPLPRSG